VTPARRFIYSAVSVIALAAVVHVVQRRRAPRSYGSNTNASNVLDLPFIAPDPASDPIAIEDAYRRRVAAIFPMRAST
jgi:hypothetical protein